MPLGGGQQVGASCYFLRLGNINIILDAGSGIDERRLPVFPDTYSVEVSPFIQSLNQVNYIFISHAHMDHIGYLPYLMQQSRNAEIFMTDMTAAFVNYQMLRNKRLGMQEAQARITRVSYMEQRRLGDIKVKFLPAGHIPGAMMILLGYRGHNILYTGDYSTHSTLMTDKCMMPYNFKIHTLIMCGLHANHPHFNNSGNAIENKFFEIYYHVKRWRTNVFCQTSQLTKGVELLSMFNEYNKQLEDPIPIYVDRSILQIVQTVEQMKIPLMHKFNHVLSNMCHSNPGIVIGSSQPKAIQCDTSHIDFSLHDTYNEIKQVISEINPQQVFLVHVAKGDSETKGNMQEELQEECGFRGNITFADNGIIYKV